MMTVHLTGDLERIIRDAVSTGRYSNVDDVLSDALTRLRRTIDADLEQLDRNAPPGASGKKLTKQEFHRHLVKIGLLDQPPENSADAVDPNELVDVEGEIVDEVVIRERLIEWLTGFLEK
jgi:Arc/MetJ-type ribon-helix-helix transcriptional regulator